MLNAFKFSRWFSLLILVQRSYLYNAGQNQNKFWKTNYENNLCMPSLIYISIVFFETESLLFTVLYSLRQRACCVQYCILWDRELVVYSQYVEIEKIGELAIYRKSEVWAKALHLKETFLSEKGPPPSLEKVTLHFQYKGPFTRAIFVAIFLILTHAIEWLSHKSIDLYSFAQMV